MLRTLLRITTIALVSGSAWGIAATQQPPGRALTIEDYYRVKNVGGTQISPDGRWVLFTVSTRLEESQGTRSELHVVPAGASAPPRHLQHEGREVANARWTDDGLIQYSVERQSWKVAPAAGGEPVKVDDEPGSEPTGRGGRGARGGAASVTSPDGKWRVLTRPQEMPKKEPTYASDFEKRHQERFKGAIFDWKDFQRDGAAFPAPDPTAQPAMQILRMPAGGTDSTLLVDLDLRPANLTWHPAGKMIAFTADPDWRDPLRYSRSDIWTAAVDGPQPQVTRLTNDGYNYSDLGYSPDGGYLSYARTFGTDMVIRQKLNHGGPRDLFVRPTAGGDPINLTASWDLEPGDSRWSPDGRYLYFTAGIGGESHLFRVAVPSLSTRGVAQPFRAARPFRAVVEQLTRGPRRIGSLTYDKAMTTIAYTASVHEAPPDVYVANVDGTNERKLSDVHKEITSEIGFSRAERLQWASHDGTKIEGWLMPPHGYDPKKGPYPLIVTSHGGPHSATGYTFDFKDQYFAANGYFVFDTNFRSSTGYGEAFKWATWGAWGDKDGQDVMSGIDFVLKRYPIDPKRIGHTGHSYGGFMTNWLITQYPDRFAAAVSGAGISNWVSDYGTADIYRTKETEFFGPPWDPAARDRMIRQSPLTHAGRVKTPTLFVHGEVDQRVPYEEGEQMYFALRRRGVPAKMIQYQGQPHGISGHWNNVHRMLNELAWWDKYLKPAPRTGTSAQGR
ncbi:MAG TPA: S9 family peptidase [Vicinamibacterales bacterium]|nr:S9 family peptidase [Vicinamibacterales bacterium]